MTDSISPASSTVATLDAVAIAEAGSSAATHAPRAMLDDVAAAKAGSSAATHARRAIVRPNLFFFAAKP